MDKQQALDRWANIESDLPVLPHFTPIAADARGSTFGACGIRISGNPDFIDAVLSRLKDLLAAEASSTRLVLSRQPVKPVSIRRGGETDVEKQWQNAADGAEVCYVQIRERHGRTRHRKALERTAPLQAAASPAPDEGFAPPAPAGETADLFDQPQPGVPSQPAEPVRRALIGRSADGEVLWDSDDSGRAEEPDL